MATTTFGTFLQEGVWRQEWPSLNGDSGLPASLSKWPNKSIQTIGAGTVVIEGSNDGITWAPLSSGLSTQGDLTALAGGSVRAIYENTVFIRPTATGAAQVIIIAT